MFHPVLFKRRRGRCFDTSSVKPSFAQKPEGYEYPLPRLLV